MGPLRLWSRPVPFVAHSVSASHLGADGSRLVIETRRRSNSDPAPWPAWVRLGLGRSRSTLLSPRGFRRAPTADCRLAGPPECFEEQVQAQHRALAGGQLTWAPIDVSVEGGAPPFERLLVGDHWLALGHLDHVDLALEGCGFDPALIALVRIREAAAWASTAT
ncbi:MAG: hypothetical protein ACRD0L_02275 [Acidimicrobiales bacterium]